MTDPDAIDEIKRAAAVLFTAGQVVEVRTFPPGPQYSGFFDDPDALAAAVAELATDRAVSGVFWTINPVAPDLLARRKDGGTRTPNAIGPAESGMSAGNADIIGRRWLYIDLDPDRPTGTAATDDEKSAAVEIGTAIAEWLAERGWSAPMVVDSGNGRHLYYPIDLPNDADATDLVKRILKALHQRFGTGAVKIDASVSNAGRIARIPGTWNRKGAGTADRPHRPVALLSVPDGRSPVDPDRLRALADEAGPPRRPFTIAPANGAAATPTADGFDLPGWIASHADRFRELGLIITPTPTAEYRFLAAVEPCPFDPSHDPGGTYIGQVGDGGLFARCYHDRCGGQDGPNRWSEFRQMVEPTGSIANRDGLTLDVLRRKRKFRRLAELDDLLASVDEGDALADDLRTVGTLVWLDFDDDAIATIMQTCRPSPAPRRADYLQKTIDKARGENGAALYDPGRYVFPDKRAEILKSTPPGIADAVHIGSVRYVTGGPLDADADPREFLRSIALYLLNSGKTTPATVALVARRNKAIPDGGKLDDAAIVALVEAAADEYAAERRRALAAAVIPDRDPDAAAEPAAAGPDVPPGIRDKAIDALETADPFAFITAVFGTVHSGDVDVPEVMTVAIGAQSCIGTQGIQPALAGPMGTGKTAAARAFVHLLPQEYLFRGSFSAKGFFYHITRPGTVVFSDDAELAPEINDLLKRAMSAFQEETPHHTLDANKNPVAVMIPPRVLWLFTAIGDQGDEQFGDRQFKMSIAADPDADKAYEEFLKKRAAAGIPDYPVTENVEVCREMLRQVKDRLFCVEIPFMPYVHFTDPGKRRIMRGLVDFIEGVTAIRFMQRRQYRNDDDPEGVVRLVATVDDLETAARIYSVNAETKRHGLSRDERALWGYIWQQGRDIPGVTLGSTLKGLYESEIIEHYARADPKKKRDGTRTAVRRLLYGRPDRGIPGGITSKVPGCYRTDDYSRSDERPKKGLIVCTIGPTLDDYETFYTFDADGWKKDPLYAPES